MSRDCVVIGAVNMDLLGVAGRLCGVEEAERLTALRTEPGGHAANCAVALARLGSPAVLYGAVGRDEHGSRVLAAAADAGVDVSHAQVASDHPTGLAFVLVLPDGERAMYLMAGANAHLSGDGIPAALERARTVVVFNPPAGVGSVVAEADTAAPVLFAPGGVAARVVEEAGPALLDASSYLIVNASEGRELTGATSPGEAALALAARWDLCAVVTDGERGCWLAEEGELEHQPGFGVEAVDSTGAGDAFTAGFAHALNRGEGAREAARFGCAAGALATRAIGAQASLPALAEVDYLLTPALT